MRAEVKIPELQKLVERLDEMESQVAESVLAAREAADLAALTNEETRVVNTRLGTLLEFFDVPKCLQCSEFAVNAPDYIPSCGCGVALGSYRDRNQDRRQTEFAQPPQPFQDPHGQEEPFLAMTEEQPAVVKAEHPPAKKTKK